MKKCVENAYPNEACGILFGEIAQIQIENMEDEFAYYYKANEFSCINSDQKSTVSFLIENIEKLNQVIREKIEVLRINEEIRLISIFHSHPSGNYPSMTDINNMRFLNTFSDVEHKFVSKAFKNLIWLIMDGTNFDISGFICLNSKIYQIEVKVNK